MARLNFDAQSVAPNSAFDPLAPGWYHVKIVDSETKPVNPPKTGSYLALTLEVIEGPSAGRKLFHNLNLENENPIAVRIAYEQLSAICYVTGRVRCEDSQELHGIPFQVKVTVRAAQGNYDASNDIKGFRNSQGIDPKDIATGNGGAAAPGAPAAPSAPGAPSAPAAPPPPPAAPAAPVAHDPVKAAEADGWAVHPTSPAYHWKGSEVHETAKLIERYPAPVVAAPPAPPAAPAAPVAPAAPAAPIAPSAPAAPPATGAAVPPWAKGAA